MGLTLWKPREVPERLKTGSFVRQDLDLRLLDADEPVDPWGHHYNRQAIESLFLGELQRSSRSDYSAHRQYDLQLFATLGQVLWNRTQDPAPYVAPLIKNFYLRAKVQRSCLAVFLTLVNHGVVSIEGLQKQVSMVDPHQSHVKHMLRALRCFEGLKQVTSEKLGDKFSWHPNVDRRYGYEEPVYWLATLIIRGALTDNLSAIFDVIESLQEWGTLDRTKLERIWPKDNRLHRDINVGHAPETRSIAGELTGPPLVQFWLPLEIYQLKSAEEMMQDFDNDYFDPLQGLYMEYFGFGTSQTLLVEYFQALI